MLSRYAAIAKNLRGVIFTYIEEDGVVESLSWLLKKFKYRDLAASPSIHKALRERGFRRLVELVYPSEALKNLVELVSDYLKADFEAVEAVVLASAYVSPIMAVGERAKDAIAPFSVKEVESRVEIDDRSWKLHFRIADYTVLDAFYWFSSHSIKLWEPKTDLELFKKERLLRIEKDMKRYWRLTVGDKGPRPFLLYIDLAQLIVNKPRLLDAVRRLRAEDASAGLSLEAAIVIKRP